MVKLLLRKGARIDAQDAAGCTPLMHAMLGGHSAVARHLLEAGADAALRNRSGVSGTEMIVRWAEQRQEGWATQVQAQQQRVAL